MKTKMKKRIIHPLRSKSKKVHLWSITVTGLAILFIGTLASFSKQWLFTSKAQETTALPGFVKTPTNEREAMMQIATAQTRHFKGDLDAPVTILEFSDFQ